MPADGSLPRRPPALLPRAVNTRGALERMEREITAGLAGLDPAGILLFASDVAALVPLSQRLAAVYGTGCRIVGCSSAGEFAAGHYRSDSVVAIGLPGAGFRLRPVLMQRLQASVALEWMLALRAAAAALEAEDAAEAAPRSHAGLLLVDGLSQREELVAAMIEATLPGLPVLGGSAGDGLRFGQTRVLLDGVLHADAAVLLLLSTGLALEQVVFDHITPTARRMVVTAAVPAERLILEIDAEPAAPHYARMIGRPLAELGPAAFAENPLLVRIGAQQFVRAISEVTPAGGLRLMSAVETGAVMTLGRAADLTHGLEERLAGLGPAVMVLGFDCILRRIALEQAGLHDKVARIFRAHNIAGFNTYGEQHGGIHVNQTFVGLAFRPVPQEACA